MKLTRKQELALIELGFQKILESLTTTKTAKTKGRKWSTAQREKFQKSMKKKWTSRKSTEK